MNRNQARAGYEGNNLPSQGNQLPSFGALFRRFVQRRHNVASQGNGLHNEGNFMHNSRSTPFPFAQIKVNALPFTQSRA
jgi:hypothetical protein